MSISPVDQKLIGVISETLQNAPIILRAFNQVGHDQNVGFTLAAACAMVQKESGGRMIWEPTRGTKWHFRRAPRSTRHSTSSP